jgi:hypothetical protein
MFGSVTAHPPVTRRTKINRVSFFIIISIGWLGFIVRKIYQKSRWLAAI